MCAWQPIETAPKDRPVDLYWVSAPLPPKGRIVGIRWSNCRWDDKQNRWSGGPPSQGNPETGKPSHWMEIPGDPDDAAGREAAIVAAAAHIYETKGDRVGKRYIGWDAEAESVRAEWLRDVRSTIEAYELALSRRR